jgi:hypothetical protein
MPFVPVQTYGAAGDGVDMFTSQELIVEARFAAARQLLARMVADGGLTGVSRDAYNGALTRLIKVGPFGDTPGISKQVQVRLIGPVQRDGTTTLWLRWEATGPAGGLFPVLDADLQLRPEGLEKARLTLNGCYRPPLGRLGLRLGPGDLAPYCRSDDPRPAARHCRHSRRARTYARPLPERDRQHHFSSAAAARAPEALRHAAPGSRLPA